MALTERLALLVTLDAKGAVKGFNDIGKAADRNLGKADQRLDQMASKFQKAGAGMLAGAGLAAVGLYKAGQSAADLEQAVGGTEAVFGEVSSRIDEFAKGAASSMGLSERAFREATTSIGGQLKGLGFTVDDAAQQAIDLTGVAADLAATYGGTTAEAVQALGAAFRGEADPAERFNLFLNQNRVNAEAVALRLADSTSNVDAYAKAQATLSLITKQSADAQGQFGREIGTAAGQMQIASAEFENAKASLGQSVAPILADIAGKAAGLASGFSTANQASGGFLSSIAAYGTIGLGAAGALSLVAGKVIELRANLGKLGTAGKVAAGAAGLLALVAVSKSLEDAFDGVQVSIEDLTGMANQELITSLRDAEAGFQTLGGSGLEPFRAIAEQSIGTAQRLRDAIAGSGEDTAAYDEILRDVSGELRQQQVDTDRTGAALDRLKTPTREAATEQKSLADRLKETADAFDGLVEATIASFDSHIGYRRSLNETEDAMFRLLGVQKEHGTNSEQYRRELLEAEDALLSQADAAVRLAEDQAEANGKVLDAEDKARIYKEELFKLTGTLQPGSPLHQALVHHMTQLDMIPGEVATEIRADTGPAFRAVGDFLAYLDAIGAKSPTGHTILLGFKQDQLAGRAIGGPVSAGSSYLVNEYGRNGPEIFTPSVNGTISPGRGFGSGSVTNNISVVSPIPEPATELLRVARREAALMGAG